MKLFSTKSLLLCLGLFLLPTSQYVASQEESEEEIVEYIEEEDDSTGFPETTESPVTPTEPPLDPNLSVLRMFNTTEDEFSGELEDSLKDAVATAVSQYCDVNTCEESSAQIATSHLRKKRQLVLELYNKAVENAAISELNVEITADDVNINSIEEEGPNLLVALVVTFEEDGETLVFDRQAIDGALRQHIDDIQAATGKTIEVLDPPIESTTPEAPQPTTPAPGDDDLEPWAIALIVLASVSAALIIAFLIYKFCIKKESKESSSYWSDSSVRYDNIRTPVEAEDARLTENRYSNNRYSGAPVYGAANLDNQYDNPTFDSAEYDNEMAENTYTELEKPKNDDLLTHL